MSKKQKGILLIEASEFLLKSSGVKNLTEAVKMSQGKEGTLIVRNIPSTILNRENQNGRIYSTEIVQNAITEAKADIVEKKLLSQAAEHPDASFVVPTFASHVIIGAYIKKNTSLVVEGVKERHDVLFLDIEILNTTEGKNLRALFEAGCSPGISIRGLGEVEGNRVVTYTFLGADIVGNPSSSTFVNMTVNESVAEYKSFKKDTDLKEVFSLTTTSTNVVRDLSAAAEIQDQLDNIGYGTVNKTSTKVDEELDTKTGAKTSITTLEAETSDDVSNLDQALAMAKNAILNPTVHVDSITIENIPDETNESVEYAPEEEDEVELVEAKKEEIADKNSGRKYVLKVPAGYVGMDGNALVFKEDPKEALHFIVGKEESGLVHLSGIEKILDTMGVFDVEKHYRKDLPVDDINNIEVNSTEEVEEEPTEESNILDGTPSTNIEGIVHQDNSLAEDGNTKYLATVVITKEGGAEESSTIPVSGVKLDSVLAEVGNLYNMKSQKAEGKVRLTVKDNDTNEEFVYEPTDNSLNPLKLTTESVDNEGEIKRDDKTLTADVEDIEVEKEFDTPEEAAIVKAGLENGELDGEVMFTETSEEDIFDTGWYVGADDIGVSGPYDTEEDARNGLADYDDLIDVEYLDNMNEKLYTNPTIASDELIDEPLNDSIKTGRHEGKVIFDEIINSSPELLPEDIEWLREYLDKCEIMEPEDYDNIMDAIFK